MTPYKRRIKLINPKFQLKLVGIFIGLATATLSAQLFLFGLDLRLLAQGLIDGDVLTDEAPAMLGRSLLLTAGMMIPVTLGVGVIVTHRIAGPIYRFEQYLRSVANGEDVGPCRIRTHDEFHELCGLINKAFDARAGARPVALATDDANDDANDAADAGADAREEIRMAG
jgi:hypothetical protein